MTTLHGHRVTFSGLGLDRADALRSDAAALAALVPAGRLLAMNGIEPAVGEDGALGWLPMPADGGADLIFLGLDSEKIGHFAAVPAPEDATTGPAGPAFWAMAAHMAPADLAVFGLVRSLAGWHARHRFCPRCGAPSALAKGGWQRNCTDAACAAEHYPRTDPVVIMTLEHDGKLLLARQPRFPAGRYGALAGFVEPGETLEEAVAREIFEEVGLRAHGITYRLSQPWPFPCSLMLGAHAYADHTDFVLDRNELEDARWFTRDQIAEAMAARAKGEDGEAFNAPMPTAVAWHLLDLWLRDKQ
jgi:NAD+ diphosphatase